MTLVVAEAIVIAVLAIRCSPNIVSTPPVTSAPTVETTQPERESHIDVKAGESYMKTEQEEKYLHTEEIPLSYELQDVMQQACDDYGVPYALALAMAECESSFDPDADNGVCWGLMQIHPINYERLRGLGIEPTEYEGNIVAGVFIIGELLDKYGDQHKALMAYNCGEGGAAELWQQGYYTSQYSRHVLSVSENWQHIIDELKNV